jgi:putative two-component system response regulator
VSGRPGHGLSVVEAPQQEECARILVVDDDRAVRFLLAELLAAAGHVVVTAAGARDALRLLDEESFGLVLSDLNMPDGSGMEIVRRVVDEHPGTAAVMITGVDDPHLAAFALDLGAYGYLLKPFGALEVEIQVENALRRRRLERGATLMREAVERGLDGPIVSGRASQEETIRRFAVAIGVRNQDTGDHVERVGSICARLAQELGWTPDRCASLRLAAVLHDVGKIAIPDRLLLKPGPLTLEERAQIERHSTIGYRILGGSGSELLTLAAEIALGHHERFDGLGYPYGLRGEQIPLEARIVSVVDVFDALTSDRPYRHAHSAESAVAFLVEGRGEQFDPVVVDAFVRVLPLVIDMWHTGEPRRHDVA